MKKICYLHMRKQRPCADLENVLMWLDPAPDHGGPDNKSLFQSHFSGKSRGPSPTPPVSAHEDADQLRGYRAANQYLVFSKPIAIAKHSFS